MASGLARTSSRARWSDWPGNLGRFHPTKKSSTEPKKVLDFWKCRGYAICMARITRTVLAIIYIAAATSGQAQLPFRFESTQEISR
jgi:hypothetical protein